MKEKEQIIFRRNWSKIIVFGMLSLVCMLITINTWGAWYAFLTFFASLTMFYKSSYHEFECSSCQKDLQVGVFRENKKCKKCKTLHVIDWVN